MVCLIATEVIISHLNKNSEWPLKILLIKTICNTHGKYN